MSITSINSNATAVLQKQLEQMAEAEGDAEIQGDTTDRKSVV